MPNVKDVILKSNAKPIPVINENSTVFDALKRMSQLNVGALLVMGCHSVSGVFTERDYLKEIVLKVKNSKTTRLTEVMSKHVICVNTMSSLNECMLIMTAKEIRHLPVISNTDGSLQGLISMRDIVSGIVRSKDFHISQLTQYITGSQTTQTRLWHSA